ncbi:MAG: hypothetical protein Q7I99_05975 [Acholeplasmataceae bacterium]|nr:hypothetical protein [Acholeplasmataceae bacterium]
MKAYLIYLFKTKWLQTLIMALLPTLIFVVAIIMSKASFYNPSSTWEYYRYQPPYVFITALVFIMLLVPIVTIFRLQIFRNSKDVDLYYSLPISRQKLLLTQLIFGLIQLLIIWSSIFLLGVLTLAMITEGYFLTWILLILYLIVIGYILIMYGITSFLFLRSNTVVDGIVFIIIFHTLFLFISLYIDRYRIFSLSNDTFRFNPFYSVGKLYFYYIHNSKPNQYINPLFINYKEQLAILINTTIFSVIALLGFVSSYFLIHNEKTEQIGRLSTSKFGYVSLIPLNLVFSTAVIYNGSSGFSVISLSVLATLGFIGFFIMRRSVRLRWFDIALVIAPIILGTIFSSIQT